MAGSEKRSLETAPPPVAGREAQRCRPRCGRGEAVPPRGCFWLDARGL